jgi:Heterokaryon incompatibility protein (HET)
MSRNMASTIYTSLDEDSLDVRFLKISPAADFLAPIDCFVSKASLIEEGFYPKYKALSYCWGDPGCTGEITLNGRIVKVRKNLESALRHLRDGTKEELLWVDALCINQNDLDERSSQVALMDSMYSDAEEVIIWLGDDSEDSGLAIDMIEQWAWWYEHKSREKGCAFTVEKDLSLAFDNTAIEAMNRLLQRDYWERVWVVQEVACAKEITVTCGRRRVSFEVFERASDAWVQLSHLYEEIPAAFDKYITLDSLKAAELRQMIKHRGFRQSTYYDWDAPVSFLDLLVSCRHLKCTDARDKIYGFLNMGGPHTSHFKSLAPPDYNKRTEDVYCEVAQELLKDDKSLRVFALASSISSFPNSSQQLVLPSWVPDWTCASMLEPMYLWFRNSSEEDTRKIDVAKFVRFSQDSRNVFAQGVTYDTVTGLYPQWLPDLEKSKDSILGALLGSTLPSGIPKFQALFRILSLNIKWPNADEAASYRRSFLNKAGWYIWKFWPRLEYEDHKVCEDLLEAFFWGADPEIALEFTRMISSGIRWKDEETQADVLSFWTKAADVSKYRVLFATETGMMGLGPPRTTLGDKICILRGYPEPFVLQPTGSWYILKGECCLAGVSEQNYLGILELHPSYELEIH